jgi:hypothetical protein
LGSISVDSSLTFSLPVRFDQSKLTPFQRKKSFFGSQEIHRKITGKSIDICLFSIEKAAQSDHTEQQRFRIRRTTGEGEGKL